MKSSKMARLQTTLGELITVLSEETQKRFDFEGNERQLMVAYILNDLTSKSVSVRHRTQAKKR